MVITVSTPSVDALSPVLDTLAGWQADARPLQLHPGDIGWHLREGADKTAGVVRVWREGSAPVAIGFLDGPTTFRLTLAPDRWHDDDLAATLADIVDDPDGGVLPGGTVSVEVPTGARLYTTLRERGWQQGDPWAPLRLDLAAPVSTTLQIQMLPSAASAQEWAEVFGAAFGSTRFTEQRRRNLDEGVAAVGAQVARLLGRDTHGEPVAMAMVWSAGPGRPGLIEPLGVRPDARGHGYGREITIAAAVALRDLGSSAMEVCTQQANTGGVAAYRSAGMTPLPIRYDVTRPHP